MSDWKRKLSKSVMPKKIDVDKAITWYDLGTNEELKLRDDKIDEGGHIIFSTDAHPEILKLCKNGDILVKGRKVIHDLEIVAAMREFLQAAGYHA